MNFQAVGFSEDAAGPAAAQQAAGSEPAPSTASAAVLHCQVPGCGQDLEGLATFYRRVRICVAHGKAYSITDANGQAMRFCQQCSRLQPLEMFSGDRRSCVASLEKRRQRRSMAAVASRAAGETSPTCEEAEWQLALGKRRSSQGSLDGEEAPGQEGLSKRHSPMRACGSLSLSIDSLPDEQILRAGSSGRGGSLGSPAPSATGWPGSTPGLGSPVPSTTGWPGSTPGLGSPAPSATGWPGSTPGVSNEGAASGVAYAAATPAVGDWQLGSSSSPLPPAALRGSANSLTPPTGARQPLSLVDLLQEAIAPSLSPPLHLLPQQQGPAAGVHASSAQGGLPPLQLPVTASVSLAQQARWQGAPVHLPRPAAQQPQPAAQPAAPAAQQPMPAAPPEDDDGDLLGWAILDFLGHAADEFCTDLIGDPSDIMQALAAGSPPPPPQPADSSVHGASTLMPAAQLEAAAAAAAAALSMGSLEGPLAELAALGLSPTLPSSPTALAGDVLQGGAAAASPAGRQPSLPPAGSQDMQQAEQWQWQQLYELQQQVEQLQHAAGRPAPSMAVGTSSPPPASASAPAGSPAAAVPAWPPRQAPGVSPGRGDFYIEVSRVDGRTQ